MRPGQLTPNEFEAAILRRFAHKAPWLHGAVDHLHVLSRKFTGVGSLTEFNCPVSSAESHQALDLEESIVMPGVPSGMGATLFCNGGQPSILDVFTYGDEYWDGVYDGFSIERTA